MKNNQLKVVNNNKPEVCSFDLASTFNVKTEKKIKILGYTYNELPTIEVDKDYVFDIDTLRDINNFVDCSFGDGLMLTGPRGSGKSSAIEQYCSRLNIPFISHTVKSSEEFQSWVGSFVLVEGTMQWRDGILTKAMKKGYILILNEADVMDPGELCGLNGVLTGAPLIITDNGGQIVHPAERFRVVITCNSNGNGNTTGEYAAVQTMSAAFCDRFLKIKVNYLCAESELEILKKKAKKIPESILTNMIKLANQVRELHGNETGEVQLSTTISTRALIRWAIQMQRLQSGDDVLWYTLDRVVLNGCSDQSEVVAITSLAEAIFGQRP